MTHNLKLSKPVKIFDKETTEIELREPLGKDIAKIGNPYAIEGGNGRMHILPDIILEYVRRLGGNIPDSVTDKFTASDVKEATVVVMGFFGDGESIPME